MDEPKKKPLDSISRVGDGTKQPVVETVAPHADTAEATPAATEKPAADAPAVAAEATATAEATDATPEQGKEDTFETMFPEPGVSISSPPSWIWWLVLLVLTLILAGVGYTLFRNRISGWLSVPSPTPSASARATATPVATATATPTETPSAAPTAAPSASAITMRVLNGTTTTGAAGKARDVLTSAGFTVRTTGNAKNQTYTKTYVYYQKGHEADAQQVAAALSSYKPTVEESTLAAPDMVLVVVGK